MSGSPSLKITSKVVFCFQGSQRYGRFLAMCFFLASQNTAKTTVLWRLKKTTCFFLSGRYRPRFGAKNYLPRNTFGPNFNGKFYFSACLVFEKKTPFLKITEEGPTPGPKMEPSQTRIFQKMLKKFKKKRCRFGRSSSDRVHWHLRRFPTPHTSREG